MTKPEIVIEEVDVIVEISSEARRGIERAPDDAEQRQTRLDLLRQQARAGVRYEVERVVDQRRRAP